MKKLLFVILTLLVLVGQSFADDQVAKETILRTLGVESDSITLVSSEEIAPSYYDAVLSFRILPSNSCQENYAGVVENDSDTYTSVYSSAYNARCKMFAQPRVVEHHFLVNLNVREHGPERKVIKLNGEELLLAKENGQLTLSRKQE